MARTANFLTTTSTLQCPHGGTVTASTSNQYVRADEQFVVRSSDGFTIGGCPYMIGIVPSPCVRVQWDTDAQQHRSAGERSLTEESVGYCLSAAGATQGTVVIVSTQNRAGGK